MNILKTIILLSLFFPYNAYAVCSGSTLGTSPNLTAYDCSYDCVNLAVNTDAVANDTVNVPACSETTWSSPLIITKGITLQGAGIGSTNIKGNITDAYNGVISYRPDAAARAANNLVRITGFTINADNKSNGIYIYNNSITPVAKVRIDHNRIINAGGSSAGRGIYVVGTVYGVADNNQIENYTHGMDSEGYDGGSPQWENLTREFGSANNFYFEDNILIDSQSPVNAGGHGGRYISRYNSYSGATENLFPVFDIHGNSPTDICGMMVVEIYGNDINLGSHGGELIDQRGGRLLAFLNKVTCGADSPYIQIREEYLDSNYPSGNSYLMHVTNSYLWNNTKNGTLYTSVTLNNNQYEDAYDLTENTDFWISPNSFNGTSGVGCGVLAARPATCTPGVAYWATNQSCSDLSGMVGANPTTPISGTLYKCTAPNTWEEYYAPYIYPHPLSGNATITIADSDPKSVDTSTTDVTVSYNIAPPTCKWRLGSAPDASNGTAFSGYNPTITGLSDGENILYVACDGPNNEYAWAINDSLIINRGATVAVGKIPMTSINSGNISASKVNSGNVEITAVY